MNTRTRQRMNRIEKQLSRIERIAGTELKSLDAITRFHPEHFRAAIQLDCILIRVRHAKAKIHQEPQTSLPIPS